jgi:hypothetical protein
MSAGKFKMVCSSATVVSLPLFVFVLLSSAAGLKRGKKCSPGPIFFFYHRPAALLHPADVLFVNLGGPGWSRSHHFFRKRTCFKGI